MTWNKLQTHVQHPLSRHNWQYLWFLWRISTRPVIFLPVQSYFYPSSNIYIYISTHPVIFLSIQSYFYPSSHISMRPVIFLLRMGKNFVFKNSNVFLLLDSIFKNVQLYKHVPSCSPLQNVWLNYEKVYKHQTTPHISYMYTWYTHTRLQNIITNIT